VKLAPLPSLRALTRELRALHAAWAHPDAGGEYVTMVWRHGLEIWEMRCDDGWKYTAGREYIPGDGLPFDAVAAARRLLAAARDAEFK